jgi:hypothetical protein
MRESLVCGDPEALVSHAYGEDGPDARAAMESHLATCASCTRAIEDLGWARRQLTAWVPPVPQLGFQLPGAVAVAPQPWWRSPLPAWAQAAAAVLIFGAGLSVGLARQPATQVSTAQVAAQPTTSVAMPTDAVSRTDLADVERRLRAEMGDLRDATRPTQAAVSDEAIMRKVQALLEQSEERQRREFTLRSVELARDFETQRRVDLASVRETVGQLQGVTGAEIRQQREAIDRINNFIRVSQQGR